MLNNPIPIPIPFQVKAVEQEKYTPKQWLMKFANIAESHIDQVFSYYKSAFITNLMSSDQELTPYRKCLKDLVTESINITEYGEIYKEIDNTTASPINALVNNVGFGNGSISAIRNVGGILNYLMLTYEEDTLLDSMVKKYDIESAQLLYDIVKPCGSIDLQKSFFPIVPDPENVKSLKEITEASTVNIVECFFSYTYKNKRTFVCVGKCNDKFVIVKCITSSNNSALVYINEKFKNGNFSINIRSMGAILPNLNNIDLVKLEEHNWMINT